MGRPAGRSVQSGGFTFVDVRGQTTDENLAGVALAVVAGARGAGTDGRPCLQQALLLQQLLLLQAGEQTRLTCRSQDEVNGSAICQSQGERVYPAGYRRIV